MSKQHYEPRRIIEGPLSLEGIYSVMTQVKLLHNRVSAFSTVGATLLPIDRHVLRSLRTLIERTNNDWLEEVLFPEFFQEERYEGHACREINWLLTLT